MIHGFLCANGMDKCPYVIASKKLFHGIEVFFRVAQILHVHALIELLANTGDGAYGEYKADSDAVN